MLIINKTMTDHDSDTDVNLQNVFTLRDHSQTVFAKGPNVNSSNLNFRNNCPSSMMNMPRNVEIPRFIERPRYAESAYDQRSVHRETSPMSFRSVAAYQPRNFHHSYYAEGMSSHRSMFNGRSGSPTSQQPNFYYPYYHEGMSSQRSMFNGRVGSPTSPVSYRTTSAYQTRNFHHSYYPEGSQRSMFNGRSGSPLSIRSIDSNASVRVANIASQLEMFDRNELSSLKKIIDTLSKTRMRKRIEKRRRRRFLRCRQYRSGGDSGEQESNSSLSSDDCQSIRSSRTMHTVKTSSSCRPTRTDFSDLRKTMQESNMYRDCTDILKKNSSRNLLSGLPASAKENFYHKPNQQVSKSAMVQKDRLKNSYLIPSQRFNQSCVSLPTIGKPNRFQNVKDDKLNTTNKNTVVQHNNKKNNEETDSDEEEIFGDSTVVEKSVNTGNKLQTKRSLDDGEVCLTNIKRTKLSSPKKTNIKSTALLSKQANIISKNNDFDFPKPQFPIKKAGNKNQGEKVISKTLQMQNQSAGFASGNSIQPMEQLNSKSPQKKSIKPKATTAKQASSTLCKNNEKSNDFVFPKPRFPIKKANNTKNQSVSKSTQRGNQSTEIFSGNLSQPMEQLISKSRQPLDLEPSKSVQSCLQENHQVDQAEVTQSSTTDISMRPSFIKRKLFTQKIDAGDNKNSSSDNIEVNSPESNIYSEIQKEKNRTRKLVVSQSCLSRDIHGDDNLLDLIHKIVPPDQMNITAATNKSEINYNKSKTTNTSNKSNISTVIAMCESKGNISDTYTDETDEEIFELENKKESKSNTVKPNSDKAKPHLDQEKKSNDKEKCNSKYNQQLTKCTVIIQPLNKSMNSLNKASALNDDNGFKKMYNCVKSFWDTDFESDMENSNTPRIKSGISRISATTHKNTIEEQVQKKQENIIPGAQKTNHIQSIKSKCVQTKISDVIPKTVQNKVSAVERSTLRNKIAGQSKTKPTFTKQKSVQKSEKPVTRRNTTPDSSINSSCTKLYRSLRNRTIDLSTSLNSSKDSLNKYDSTKSQKQFTGNKVSSAVRGKEANKKLKQTKDISFTLTTGKHALNKQLGATKRIVAKAKNNDSMTGMKTRQSDVSFSLISDSKNLNKTSSTSNRSSTRCKNISFNGKKTVK